MMGLSKYNPAVIVCYYAAVVGVTMFCMNPVILTLSLIGATVWFFVQNGTRHVISHGFYILLFLGMALINPLVSHKGSTVLLVINDNPVTLEAFIYGCVAALMVIAALYWFRTFTVLMTSDRLLYVFSLLSPRLALCFSMCLRYVPLLGNQFKKVYQAQKALGLYRDDTILDQLKGGLRVISIMITWSLENGIITADSMTARGYGTGRRTTFRRCRFGVADGVCLSVIAALLLTTVFGMSQVTVSYYPEMTMSVMTMQALIGYAAFAVLVLLPTILQVKEVLWWAYLRSKI